MREVAPELLSTRTGGVVYVDGADECRAEAGELEGFEGKLVEIGSLGGAGVVERQEDADLTVWKSVCRGQRWRVSTMGVRRLRPCFPLTLARRSASASRTLPSRTSSFGRARSSVSARSSRSEMATPCAATYVVSIGGSSFALVPAIARPPPPPPRPFVESRLSVDGSWCSSSFIRRESSGGSCRLWVVPSAGGIACPWAVGSCSPSTFCAEAAVIALSYIRGQLKQRPSPSPPTTTFPNPITPHFPSLFQPCLLPLSPLDPRFVAAARAPRQLDKSQLSPD